MERNVVLSIAIALILGLILGFLGGSSSSPISQKETKEEIKKAFVKELREKGVLPPEPGEITNVRGTVKNVSKNQLILNLEERFDDPLGEFLPKTIIVNITGKTEIFKLKEKPPEVFQKEEKSFNRKLREYEARGKEIPADLTPPDPFTKKKIKLSEIEKGNRVSATSKTDIKNKSEFTATIIEVEEAK